MIRTITMLALSLAFAATGAQAGNVAKSERELVVVSELVTHSAQYRWLYRFMEASGVSLAWETLGSEYRTVYALTGERATLENFNRGLGRLAENGEVKALDVFLHLHGGPKTLYFREGGYATEDIARRLTESSLLPSKLRLAYSTACYGASHAGDLLAGGFEAVSGSRRVNTNGAYDYPAVLTSWRAGETIAVAQDWGNVEFFRRLSDDIASTMGFGDVDSYKDVFGASELTIGSSNR